MKQLLMILCCVACAAICNAQVGVKIIDLPLKSNDPTGSYLPISDAGTTKKLNVNMIGVWDTYVRNDSLFKLRFNTESFVSRIKESSTVSLTAVRTLTGNTNVVEILHGQTDTPESASVKVSISGGDPADYSNFITKIDATRIYLIYSVSPIGTNITYRVMLVKSTVYE